MINAEKFLKEGVSVEELCFELAKYCTRINFNGFTSRKLKEYFESTTTPTLTEDERVILRNIEYGYKYIYRHCSYLYIKSFEKGCFDTNKVNMERKFDMYDHLFQFIKERRRILY